jgi:beta-phosphoglucomutase-like phosphatase (HAD superfamily)
MKYKAIIFDLDGTILFLENLRYTANTEGVLVDSFLAFHAKAKELNLKMAIATNASTQITQHATNVVGLDSLFAHHIYTASLVAKGKPSPDIYLHAAAQLNVAPEECIVIEDSHNGLRAARDAGMFCIGINTGKQLEQLMLAHLKIDHYDEIDLEKLLSK